jgi:WD40 repeat protein
MDLLLSISTMDNNIKLWNVKNFECFADIKNPNSDYWIFSTCFLSDNNETCIVTSNGNLGVCEYIEVFDIHGNKIKEINESNDDTYFIDAYTDNKNGNNYIITGNNGFVKSFAYNKNRIYNIYDDNDNKPHHSVIINNKDVFTKLIESSVDGNIRIWNFHSGELLNRIRAGNNYLNGICLWNNDYLFVACNDKVIKLIDLKRGIVLKDLIAHSDRVSTVKKVFHPHYGECLISQGKYNDQIKIWTHKI